MKQFVTKISNIPNPQALEVEIGIIQNQLANSGWVEMIFGVANIQKRVKSEDESITSFNEGNRGTKRYDVYYPQGLLWDDKGGKTDVDLTFDDTYSNRIFFLNTDDINSNASIDNWDWTSKSMQVVQSMSLIFHCNLDSMEYQSSEFFKNSILLSLQNCSKVTAKKLYESVENVWKEFTITPEMQGITRYPNYCLRVDFTITYLPFNYNVPV